MVRLATEDDIQPLLLLGKRFAEYAGYDVGYSAHATRALLLKLLNGGGAVIVAEENGEVVGVILGVLSPFWYSPDEKVAIEMAWWMDPESRSGGSARKLVSAFEQWAHENGARFVSLCDMQIDGEFLADGMIRRMGYQLKERTHIKEI